MLEQVRQYFERASKVACLVDGYTYIYDPNQQIYEWKDSIFIKYLISDQDPSESASVELWNKYRGFADVVMQGQFAYVVYPDSVKINLATHNEPVAVFKYKDQAVMFAKAMWEDYYKIKTIPFENFLNMQKICV